MLNSTRILYVGSSLNRFQTDHKPARWMLWSTFPMNYSLREGTPSDIAAIKALLPRLADYDLPPRRVAEHLWEGDAELLEAWGQGKAPQCFVTVAAGEGGEILGVALVSLRPELLSHAPSAHLEALAISAAADGHGIGRALLQAAERTSMEHGALSMTLHVFGNNTRARHIYRQGGYAEELIRCIKHLDQG